MNTSLIDWNNIDTILLDMDGTLLDLNFDNYFWMKHLPKRYCDIHGGDLDQVRMDLYRKIMSKKGDQLWYDLTYWSDELDVDICALKYEIQHLIHPLPNSLKFLEYAKSLGKQLFIVTNAHEGSVDVKMKQMDLSHHFERIVLAFEYGYAKEQEEFWPLLQADLDYDPSRTLFVDDNIDVVRMAMKTSSIAEVVGLRCPDSQGTRNEMPGVKAVDTLGDLLPYSAMP